jgi:HPt (histidine-containing phosphotransfer) domain-containing protein
MDIKGLERAGIDYEEGLERFMGDADLYQMVLRSFLDDGCLERARTAFDARDADGLFSCAHETKGSAGNASMTDLYRAACALVETLRAGRFVDDEVAPAFADFTDAYGRARSGISKAL